jgi:hypothetical protein
MNNLEISHFAKSNTHTKNYFKGCVTVSQLKKIKLRKKSFVIVNICPLNLPHCHWTFVGLRNRKLIYFCTSGTASYVLSKQFNDWINKQSFSSVWINKKPLQPENSSTCGLHCLCFANLFCKNADERLYNKLFSNSLRSNESVVKKLFKKLYNAG